LEEEPCPLAHNHEQIAKLAILNQTNWYANACSGGCQMINRLALALALHETSLCFFLPRTFQVKLENSLSSNQPGKTLASLSNAACNSAREIRLVSMQ
jgi:hypothetical protein